jgi:isoquinoline 1-oxidoreductase alpha subunit
MAEAKIGFRINGQAAEYRGDGDKPLLWHLRDGLRLTGTKYGCGAGLCGACTVHVDGEAVAACTLPMSAVSGKSVTTIEGLANGPNLHPVQQAWIDEDVAQCGYCQAGQVMAAVALLRKVPDPGPADIDGITNLCRCGTYPRVRRAIARAAKAMGGKA